MNFNGILKAYTRPAKNLTAENLINALLKDGWEHENNPAKAKRLRLMIIIMVLNCYYMILMISDAELVP